MPLVLEIVTPEARVYRETVDSVVLPTSEGEVGVLPGHLPLLCQLEAGELRVQRGTVSTALAVGRGFAEVDGDSVSVLAESAINADDIDDRAVEQALKRAQEALAGVKNLTPEESEQFEALARFAAAQQLVRSRRRP